MSVASTHSPVLLFWKRALMSFVLNSLQVDFFFPASSYIFLTSSGSLPDCRNLANFLAFAQFLASCFLLSILLWVLLLLSFFSIFFLDGGPLLACQAKLAALALLFAFGSGVPVFGSWLVHDCFGLGFWLALSLSLACSSFCLWFWS